MPSMRACAVRVAVLVGGRTAALELLEEWITGHTSPEDCPLSGLGVKCLLSGLGTTCMLTSSVHKLICPAVLHFARYFLFATHLCKQRRLKKPG
eukprot:scaffold45520_cov64-Phaeocystis_antarctica.AAC.5